jgi:hypothetical protein
MEMKEKAVASISMVGSSKPMLMAEDLLLFNKLLRVLDLVGKWVDEHLREHC